MTMQKISQVNVWKVSLPLFYFQKTLLNSTANVQKFGPVYIAAQYKRMPFSFTLS